MIFKIGTSGENVKTIQHALKSSGFIVDKIDGLFGEKTKAAVIQFQKQNKINADGIVGIVTWEKLLPRSNPTPPELLTPKNREELYHLFGDPLEDGYWKAYGGFCETPLELNHVFTYEHNKQNGFWCNKLLIPLFKRVYEEIVREKLSHKLFSFDGCWNIRYTRGEEKLSMHSWGIAVDHNAKTNPLGSDGDMDLRIIKIFSSEGFYWGGNFKRKDPMHFEFTTRGI